jgi:predicted AAA+ superfamily ATPase
MYARKLQPPKSAFFLFGPRGVGKSTWLKNTLDNALFIDLLPGATQIQFAKDPSMLSARVRTRPKREWVVIDEIQKVPALLDEVHSLMENHGYKKFAMSGSSARKLKRGGANMLAGRAVRRALFPFTSSEVLGAVDPSVVLEYGLLPMSVNASTNEQREDFLRSYLTTYIQEEIKAEGLVRNIGHFARFLDIAALSAATQPNISGLSRDAGISRDTAQGYFSVFEDTLLGSWLPAYRPRAKIKEVISPKFYWFDPGVLHAASGGFDQPMPAGFKGVLLEHWIHHELKAYLHYNSVRGSLGFWRTPSGTEVDFVFWYGNACVGIEVKSSTTFRREYLKGLQSLSRSMEVKQSYLIYLGEEELKIENVWVLPVLKFLKLLHRGEVM